MNTDKQPYVYTAADIRRYLDGNMSPAEMYAIEKAALDDPLLAEAIEGYEAIEDKDLSIDLAALKQKLTEVENTPVAPVFKSNFTRYWKAAAAVLIITSSIAVAWIFTNKKDTVHQALASKEQGNTTVGTTTDSISLQADTATRYIAADHPVNTTAPGSIKVDSAVTGKYHFTATDSVASNDFVYTPPSKAAAPAPANDWAAAEKQDVTIEKDAAPAASDKVYLNNGVASNSRSVINAENTAAYQNNDVEKRSVQNNAFNIQVIASDNTPIAQANIHAPQLKKTLLTDAKGLLNINAPDTSINVVVTAAGYNSYKARLSNRAPQQIVLQPAAIAQQIQIGKKKETAAVKPATSPSATEEEEDDIEPFGGWVQYNNYIDNHRNLPSSALQQNIHGEVEVKITLKSNGEIAQVKVEKPLCPECDAEAVRLITEGPKWDVKSKKAREAKVKVKF